MENQSDHDLLIALNTKMEMLLLGQQRYIEAWGRLLERVTAIEVEQGRHDTEINTLQDNIADLQKKTSLADNVNMGVAAATNALAVLGGQH